MLNKMQEAHGERHKTFMMAIMMMMCHSSNDHRVAVLQGPPDSTHKNNVKNN